MKPQVVPSQPSHSEELDMITKGIFATFEGPDGCGKSTQIRLLKQALEVLNIPHITTREPGGSFYAEWIRRVLIEKPSESGSLYDGDFMTPVCETFLFLAARNDHTVKRIKPALDAGKHVLCDRYGDSTLAYQFGGNFHGDPAMQKFILQANAVAMGGIIPDITILLNISIDTMKERLGLRSQGELDAFEQREGPFQQRMRETYKWLAEQEPQRIVTIDGERSVEEISADVLRVVGPILGIPAV